ncbi:hypothetical protein ANANG_G00117510 [Anguilla anguilla]|uniref:A-kinase anchor protein 7 RI-RII subunit-binding domain-containing protein n=1 Tax=Anguilla anguilla TaxID=7936 RepID=A0A9D3MCV5_ANGAN|nr:hypothetical protein ANANG_G00117510 [Anguilla anguilla]
MGQLCCFPFSRAEEKINLIQGAPHAARTSEKKGAEPDDEELQSLSKRLVEDAVLRAVQQYMEETQRSAGGPGTRARPSRAPTSTPPASEPPGGPRAGAAAPPQSRATDTEHQAGAAERFSKGEEESSFGGKKRIGGHRGACPCASSVCVEHSVPTPPTPRAPDGDGGVSGGDARNVSRSRASVRPVRSAAGGRAIYLQRRAA